MRTFMLTAIVAALCLAMSGCGVAGDVLGALDTDSDDAHDPIVVRSQAEDVPPSMAVSGDSSF